MALDVYLYASLAKYLPRQTGDKLVQIPAIPGGTARDILRQLRVPEKEVKLIFINGVRRDPEAQIKDGDRIGFFPPVGGG